MLRLRDRKILEALQLFRCMSRDQIATLYFRHVKNPITAANYVLKRLRRDQYIDVNMERKPYVYLLNPSTVKKNSQKIDHYLKIVDFYIDLCQYEEPIIFEVEKRHGPTFMQPDIFTVWRGKAFFVEIQNSRYTTALMQEKIQRYI
ncbi:replication-relaxation family protein [Bacillus thuringiensis]|uniref:replication-relaxation family protein n=1 Tax=Bacillus thuringiensis TaxID=1428 RepID=UPI001EE899E6|nr:replication-relaxation family protein [Bacillus thuringiensis]MDZ3953398.1 replication-relaxation family protein [Bacillus thuringiensis]